MPWNPEVEQFLFYFPSDGWRIIINADVSSVMLGNNHAEILFRAKQHVVNSFSSLARPPSETISLPLQSFYLFLSFPFSIFPFFIFNGFDKKKRVFCEEIKIVRC